MTRLLSDESIARNKQLVERYFVAIGASDLAALEALLAPVVCQNQVELIR